ncbi:imidazole glycerol phosphate synthase subunit HisH [Candidatus Micrarchaeota archaeon]|nr:imidazole glycerol phosphate synthase subunit HisH [Candidatus Micrarchaeota archaeon]
MKIAIIDYGAGNTANVKNAFDKLGANAIVSDSEADWKSADALVLPGVGAFGAAMEKLGNKKKTITEFIESGKPFLGICLGMQLLLEISEESSGAKGLGIIKGKVRKFQTNLPVPQIGWNKVQAVNCALFYGVDNFYAYFANSYYCEPQDKSIVAGTSEYGTSFAAAFALKNVFATQFHPEKSGKAGLQVLSNFIKMVRK